MMAETAESHFQHVSAMQHHKLHKILQNCINTSNSELVPIKKSFSNWALCNCKLYFIAGLLDYIILYSVDIYFYYCAHHIMWGISLIFQM